MKETMPRYIKQYAIGVIDYSTQYGAENPRSFSYSVSNLIGEPQIFPRYGDYTQAAVMRTYGTWWDRCPIQLHKKDTRPKAPGFQSEDYIDVIFEQPVYPWSIAIYETYNPGALVRILALCQEFPKQNAFSDDNNQHGVDPSICGKAIPLPLVDKYTHWEVLWSINSPQKNVPKEARMFAPILHEITYQSRIIRLEFCHTHLDYYTELDAVELTGTLSYSFSSPVDPPTTSMSCLSISPRMTPCSSTEELAYLESKIDYKAERAVAINTSDVTMTDQELEFQKFPNGSFSYLPAEIISKIFGYLSFPDLCRAACVNKLFYMHSYDPAQINCIDLHSHWHIASSNALESIQARCKMSNTPDGVIQHLNLKWLGGGDIVTSEGLNFFFESCNFQMLTYLNLASSPSVTDTVLSSIARFMPNLNFLDIQSCDKASVEGIRILHKFTKLRALNLYRSKVDDAGIICVIHSNPDLTSLNIGSCAHIRDYDRVLIELSEHCLYLKMLDTWRAKSLTSLGLKALVSKCKYLEELDFGWCGTLQSSSGCFLHLAKSCPHLKKLFLTTNRTISDTEINLFAKHCTDLRQLDILGTRLVTPHSIENLLYRCRHLEFLDLSFCFSFTVEVVESLRLAYPHVAIKKSFQD